MSQQEENIESVRVYFVNSRPSTSKGEQIKGDALRFIDDIGAWDTESDWNQVASYRNMYNIAEGVSNTKEVLQHGTTYPETMGKGRPKVDIDTGEYGEPKPLIPTKYKVLTVIGIVVVGILSVLNLENAVVKGLFQRKR